MIAREGWIFIFIGLSLTTVSIWLAARWDNLPFFIFSLLLGLLTIFTAYFFRDPERSVPDGQDLILSPADGTVLAVDTLKSHPFVGEKPLKISIFLSVFNVHINRVPVSGQIDYSDYNPGEFFAAFEDKASSLNEQTEIGMTTSTGQKIVFKQIAGVLARRIVNRLETGDTVSAGDRFGMIRFGSRAEIIMPAGTRIDISTGDKVTGGVTVLATFVSPENTDSPREATEFEDGRL